MEKNLNARSRLARGIDYFSLRITAFLLVLLILSEFISNFYLNVILASFITAFLNRQVNAFKQKRLTRAAKEKSAQLSQDKEESLKEPVKEKGLKAYGQSINFLLSGFFLLGLAVFFEGWFKYYFLAFGVLNLMLAILYFYKLNNKTEKKQNIS